MTVRLTRLPNGLRVVTEHMPGLKSAAVGVWVNVGCRHEEADQNGIAHFLEHMAFKGTEKRTALQIAEEIEDVGGYINAYTSREMTAYYARVLEEDVPRAVDVISDIVLNPAFDPQEIEIERGVILQEIGQSHDTPDDIIFDWLQEKAYPGQPMGRPILGPAERVRAFARDDFSGFVQQHYRPRSMILSAAGAVDHDAIVRMAEEAFGAMPMVAPTEYQPATFQGGEHRVEKPLEQVHFALALEAPSNTAEDLYAAQIHANALGGGMSSRLFQEVREKRGLCYTIYAHAGSFADSGMLTIYAGTGADEINDLAHVTVDELARITRDLTEEEVARARAQMKAGLLMGLESASSRAERIARLTAIWDRVPPLEETVAKIDAVDLAAVKTFGERYLSQTPAMVLYGPVSQAPDARELGARMAG